jgi:hypothetical protein
MGEVLLRFGWEVILAPDLVWRLEESTYIELPFFTSALG